MADKLVVIGQGYVGLPVAVRAVEAGFDVVGYDTAPDKVKRLAAGESYVEDVQSGRLAAALASKRYQPSTHINDAAGFDYAVISVPTPLREGVPDLTFIEEAALTLAPFVTRGATVILESTTYPGTTEEFLVPILEDGSGLAAGTGFFVGYSPERIDPGNVDWRFENTPKVVAGIDAKSLNMVKSFYDRLVETTVPVSSPKEAELTKLLENTFRHVNIALVNELAMFANDLGIDVWEAIDAAATKPFGFMAFRPGPGVGGHCLPIDPSYLSWQVRRSLGQSFRFVELANDVNEHMPDYVVRRLIVALNQRNLPLKGQRVLLLGLSYKKATGDARESPSRQVARHLVAMGADVCAVDPYVSDAHVPPGVRRTEFTTDEIRDAQAVVLLVDHPDFDPSIVLRESTYILDTRGVLPAASNVEKL